MVHSVTDCIAKFVAEKVKYDPIYKEHPGKIDGKIKMNSTLHCIADCLGQKGKWQPDFKKIFAALLHDPKLSEKANECIINQLEDDYSPVDLVQMFQDDLKKVQNHLQPIIAKCASQ